MSGATEERIEAAAEAMCAAMPHDGGGSRIVYEDAVVMAGAALSANEHHDAEERLLHYGRTVRNGVHTDRPDGFTDVEWHLSAMADTGTSHNLPGRLYIVQCEWCPKAFAAETKAEAMQMFRAHEKTVQEETR